MRTSRKIAYVVSWLPVIVIKLSLALIGLILVPVGLALRRWPRVLWLWGNREHPVSPLAGVSNYRWLAIRNPVNNSRFIFKDREPTILGNWSDARGPMEAAQIIEAGYGVAWRWSYSGPFAGYRRVWINSSGKYSEFWIGWKVGSAVPGMGFTLQLRLKREIGT
jgi:hypothetical protein